nr:hypothetical protein DOP62_10605 [Synechococcus elongatus PCC 11801]
MNQLTHPSQQPESAEQFGFDIERGSLILLAFVEVGIYLDRGLASSRIATPRRCALPLNPRKSAAIATSPDHGSR